MAFLDAKRFDVSLVASEIAPFDEAPAVLARGPQKAVLVRDASHA